MNFATCELCNDPFLREHEVCYIDGNPRNKTIANIAILCPSCTNDVANFENSELLLRYFFQMKVGKEDYRKLEKYLIFRDQEMKLNAADLIRDNPNLKDFFLKRSDPWAVPLKKLCNLLKSVPLKAPGYS